MLWPFRFRPRVVVKRHPTTFKSAVARGLEWSLVLAAGLTAGRIVWLSAWGYSPIGDTFSSISKILPQFILSGDESWAYPDDIPNRRYGFAVGRITEMKINTDYPNYFRVYVTSFKDKVPKFRDEDIQQEIFECRFEPGGWFSSSSYSFASSLIEDLRKPGEGEKSCIGAGLVFQITQDCRIIDDIAGDMNITLGSRGFRKVNCYRPFWPNAKNSIRWSIARMISLPAAPK